MPFSTRLLVRVAAVAVVNNTRVDAATFSRRRLFLLQFFKQPLTQVRLLSVK
jgi:hypothetical protein